MKTELWNLHGSDDNPAGRWWRVGLVVALLIWGGGLARASLATAAEPVTIHLKPGEERDVVINLGRDSRTDLDFLVRVAPPDSPAWRDGLLSISLPVVGDPWATEQRIPHDPAGRRVRVRASALRCSPQGSYNGVLEIISVEKLTDQLVGSVEEIPLVVEIEADLACVPVKARAGATAGLLFLVSLYVGLMASNSVFLSPRLLASRLQPLRWTELGDLEGALGGREELLRRISRQLSPWKRALAWLLANPLAFGLPGKSYQETVRIVLGRKPDDLFLEIEPRRRAFQYFREHPEAARGKLFATATPGRGILFFGLPDKDGRIGQLQLREVTRQGQVSPLVKADLVEAPPPGNRAHRPAGWKILGLGGRP